MKPIPFFSVTIVTYNSLASLRRAVDSIFEQTDPDWELIVVDNHSTDGTGRYLEQIADPRVRFFSIRNDGIVAKSRNVSFAHSRGRYVAILDADDYWFPTKLRECRLVLEKNPELIGVCHAELYESGGRRWPVRHGPYPADLTAHLFKKGGCLSPSASVFKLEAYRTVGGFSEDPGIATAEDYDAWFKLSRTGVVAYLSECLGVFVLHENNTSYKQGHCAPILAGWKVYHRHFIIEMKRRSLSGREVVLSAFYLRRFFRSFVSYVMNFCKWRIKAYWDFRVVRESSCA